MFATENSVSVDNIKKANSDIFGEKDLIEQIKRFVDPNNKNLLGYNEDAIAIKLGNKLVVLNIDGWVASSDRPKGLSLHDCGYRAVINAASDIIVKGAKLNGMIVSLSIPKDIINNATEIISGISNAASLYNIDYLGGDLNSSSDITIDVAIWGICTKQLVKRNGAKVGQKLCWLGPPLGSTAVSLGILTKNWVASSTFISKSLKVMGQPKLFPEFLDINASSAIDCSDGLAISLYHLAKSSNIGFDLFPIENSDDWIMKIAEINNQNIQDLSLYGGEELGIIFTCDQKIVLPNSVIVLGEVTKQKEILIAGKKIDNKGWQHFIS